MAESLQTIEETETQTSKARPLLRKALAVVGLAATFGSASPAMAAAASSASGAHEAAAHKTHHKVAETPVQKTLKSDLINFAGQIITDYEKDKINPLNQPLAHGSSPCGVLPGNESFCVSVPVLDTVDGVTETPAQSADGYSLSVSLDYPNKLLNNPPSTPDANYVGVSEDTAFYYPGNPFTDNPFLPAEGQSFDFVATGNSTTNAWDVCQYMQSPSEPGLIGINPAPLSETLYYWAYATAPTSQNCNEEIPRDTAMTTPLTMAELGSETGVVQTLLNSAPPQVETLVSLASLPAPASTALHG